MLNLKKIRNLMKKLKEIFSFCFSLNFFLILIFSNHLGLSKQVLGNQYLVEALSGKGKLFFLLTRHEALLIPVLLYYITKGLVFVPHKRLANLHKFMNMSHIHKFVVGPFEVNNLIPLKVIIFVTISSNSLIIFFHFVSHSNPSS